MAIRFLGSIAAETRLAVRRLVLHEDHESVVWPESHGQGLILFCQENSNLRVERRISLWRTVLPSAFLPLHELMCRTPEALQEYKYDRVTPWTISRGHSKFGGVAGWIMEALALESVGMPTPEISTHIFDVLQRDAAWKSAYEQCIVAPISRLTAPRWLKIRENHAYIMRGFPEALQEICCGRSLVKCNFDTGSVQDIDQIVVQGRTWTESEWNGNWQTAGRL
jgi:hypothetical protein